MASVPGGRYVFSAAEPVNLVLTPDGNNLPPPIPGDFNLEVFTATQGTPDPTYDGAAFAPAGTLGTDGTLDAQSLTLLNGDYQVNDLGGSDVINAGSGNQTIAGGSLDTINGGSGTLVAIAGIGNVVNVGDKAGAATVNALAGNDSVNAGSQTDVVYSANGDTVNAGSGQADVIFGSNADPTLNENLTLQGAAGTANYTVASGAGSMTGAAANVTIVGTSGDTISVGNTTATINASVAGAGTAFQRTLTNEAINLGAGAATVFGGAGDTITAGSGSALVMFGPNMTLSGAAAAQTFTVTSGAGSLTGSASNVAAVLDAGDTIAMGSDAGTNATINGLAGTAVINLGAGNATVFGVAGDTVHTGSGNGTLIIGSDPVATNDENLTVSGAAILNNYTVSSAATGTFVGGAKNVTVVGVNGDTVSVGKTNAVINAFAGAEQINLGSNDASVFAAAGDTINAGSGNGTVIVGTDTTKGSTKNENLTVTGATKGNTLTIDQTGGALSVSVSAATVAAVGAAGDTINSGATAATINAIAGNEAVEVGGKGTASSVFGGTGDTIGVARALAPSGNDLFLHSAGQNGEEDFGSFSKGVGTSTANVTVGTVNGGGASEGFNTATDFVFYNGSTDAEDAVIIAAAKNVDVAGVSSAQFTLPDGTTMTLVGVTTADLTVGMFKPL